MTVTLNDASERFNLARFTAAQTGIYEIVVKELAAGRKRTHWMWFIFPQLEGLGTSPTARLYAIKSLDEARAYLAHPMLGARLLECTRLVNAVEGRTAHEIFSTPDDLKFHSSMTLFELASPPQSEFSRAIEKYFRGERDRMTLQLLQDSPAPGPKKV